MTSLLHRTAVITVQFSQTVYNVSEEEGQVVVLLSVLGQSDITIHNQLYLQTMAQSATCKNTSHDMHGIISCSIQQLMIILMKLSFCHSKHRVQ